MSDPIVEGQRARNPRTGERIIYQRGRWYPLGPDGQAQGATAPRSSPTPTGRPLTQGQAQDGFNASRMVGAGNTIQDLEGNNFDAGLANIVPEPVRNSNTRQYNAAQTEWADSLLRMTTGAAATEPEVQRIIGTYFPRVGDDATVRQQRARMRDRVERDAISRAGPAGQTAAIRNWDEDARRAVRQASRVPAGRRNAAAPAGQGYRIISVE